MENLDLELNVGVNTQKAEQGLDSLKQKADETAESVGKIGEKTEESITQVNGLGNAFEGVFQNAVQDAGKLGGNLGDIFKAVKQGIPTVKSLNRTALTGLTGIKAALAGLGIGILISGITFLVSKLVEYAKKTSEAKRATSELNSEINKTASSAAALITQFTFLAKSYRNLGDSIEAKEKFLVDHRKEIENLGLAVNDVNTANKVFIEDTSEYISALRDRAKAEGAYNLAIEKTKEYLEGYAELEEEKSKIQEKQAKEGLTPAQQNLLGAQLMGAQKKLDEYESAYNDTIDKLFEKSLEFAASSSAVFGTGSVNTGSIPTAQDIYDAWAKTHQQEIIEGENSVAIWEARIKREGELAKRLAEIHSTVYSVPEEEIEEKSPKDYLKEQQERKEQVYDFQKELLDIEVLSAREKNNKLYQIEEDRLKSQKTLNEQLLSITLDPEEQQTYLDEIERINKELEILGKKRVEQTKKDLAEETTYWAQAAQSIADIIGTIIEAEEERIQRDLENRKISESEAKEQFERLKGWQIAQTWINTLSGMTAALTAPLLQGNPLLWPVAAAQAAALLANGIAQTAKIRNTEFGSTPSGDGGGAPNMTGVTPIQVGEDIQPSPVMQQSSFKPSDQRVYILQADLEDSHRQVQIREDNSTF